jgi:hypothetical protein
MDTTVLVAIIGGVSLIMSVTLPFWIKSRMDKMDKQIRADRDQCRLELEEAKEETRKAIKLAIEQYNDRQIG